MTNLETLNQFVQRVYLTRYNRYIDNIEDEDGQIEVDKTIDWANMFLDELESETDNDGQPIDWSFSRENDREIGTIGLTTQTFDLDTDILRLVVDENRPMTITQDGTVVSTWEVVEPNQITKRTDASITDRVTAVNGVIIFSRALNETEIDGKLVGDVINVIPRLSNEGTVVNINALKIVKPYQLMVLGVAKNATLPDIVQGGLSPSFVQKYADLLELTKSRNGASSVANEYVSDDSGSIGGVW